MKALRLKVLVLLAPLACMIAPSAAPAQIAAVEERLDQLNRLPEKSRAESLEKEAHKEGEVVWCA
jgi:hypothetical protein